MQETGKVISRENDIVRIQITRGKNCGRCKVCSTDSDNNMILTVKNTIGAKIGDTVNLKIDSGYILFTGFLVYIMPVIFLLAGLITGKLSGWTDFKSLGLGFLMFIAACCIIYFYDKKNKKNPKSRIELIA